MKNPKRITLIWFTLIALAGVAGTTNYGSRSTNNGTRMQITPTTSALWRSILPSETIEDSLWALGLTNDATGSISRTNIFGGGSNAPGKYISSLTSTNNTVQIGPTSTNQNGGVIVDIEVGANIVQNIAVNSTLVNNLVNQSTNLAATLDGFTMAPAVEGGTNKYWWDFGRSNTLGQKLIYATFTATNNCEFVGVTNGFKWGLLSFNAVASGGNRILRLPPNLPHLDTNGLTLTNGAYELTLTNGNEFRMTIQSNSTLSTLWTTFGQP